MRIGFLLIVLLSLSCSLFENEQDFEIYPPNILGEWVRSDFEGNTEFFKSHKIDTTSIDNFIRYNFFDDKSCVMEGRNPGSFRFYNCEWNIYGDEPDIYLSTQFEIDWGIWPGPLYWDLYKITELSEDRITLRLLDSSHDED